MTSPSIRPADAVLVAIDIAKLRNEVLIEAARHKRRRRLAVLNTRAEHDRLIDILQAFDRPVVCGFEATGNYHRPIAWRLAEAGFEVRLVSSLALARTREALHNSWDKNDPKDAQVILHAPQGADEGGVCGSRLGCCRLQSQQDTDSHGYLRDGAHVDRTAAAA